MLKSFLLRLEPALFKALQKRAEDLNLSVNAHCISLLQEACNAPVQKEHAEILNLLKEKYGKHLLGLVLFGSTARGTAQSSSDIDLLIVLNQKTSINSSTYREWDALLNFNESLKNFADKISPHFVHLPQEIKGAGSLWLEVALEGKIIWEHDNIISTTLRNLRQHIAEGRFVRSYSYGIPYWKKAS